MNPTSLPSIQPPGRQILPVAMAAGVAVFLVLLAFGNVIPAASGGLASVAVVFVAGWLGLRQERTTRQRVAESLADYQLFTHLMRAQNQRIVDLTTDAAQVILRAMTEIDTRCSSRAGPLNGDEPQPESDELSDPTIKVAGALQFQDVTQQQLAFLGRLSLTLDDHMNNLAAALTDRHRLDHLPRFRDLFRGSVDHAVMISQRQDHNAAIGHEDSDSPVPAVEMFLDDQGMSDAHSRG